MAGDGDERIRTADYHSDQVYRVTGRVGYELDLEFGEEERFVGLAAGDVQGVGFESQANHLFLKPRAERVATNLTVLTTRHHYQLDYRVQPQLISRDRADGAPAVMFALRFRYPEEERQRAAAATLQRSVEQGVAEALDAPLTVVNRAYKYCGPPALKPQSVVDDGVRTRFTFGAEVELPAIFARGADGAESLLNFTVNGDGITIHRIAPQFVLRRGKLVGCVVNEAYRGAGSRLTSGSVSPQVQRQLPVAPDASGPPGARDAAR
jgi:type IV secretion system protein VirB9